MTQPSERPEQWRTIPGYPDYQASTLGRIRRAPGAGGKGARPGHILRPSIGRYAGVNLYSRPPRQRHYRHVHVLIAAAWIGPRPPGREIAHLDDNPLNNRPENLAYSLPADNRRTGPHEHGMPGERNPARKLDDAAVLALRSPGYRHGDALRIARQYGVHPATAYRARRADTWQHLDNAQPVRDGRSTRRTRRPAEAASPSANAEGDRP